MPANGRGWPASRFTGSATATAAPWERNTGAGRDVVRVLLGHSSDAMAARYTHLSEGYMREAVERLVEVRGRLGASAITEQPSDEKAR